MENRTELKNDEAKGVVILDAFKECHYCKKMLPLSDFGLRFIKQTGTIRDQPRCKPCRSKK